MHLKLDLESEPTVKRLILERSIEFYRAGGRPTMAEWEGLSEQHRAVMREACERVQAASRMLDAGTLLDPARAMDAHAEAAAGRQPEPPGMNINEPGNLYERAKVRAGEQVAYTDPDGTFSGTAGPDGEELPEKIDEPSHDVPLPPLPPPVLPSGPTAEVVK